MKIQLESTTKIVQLVTDNGSVPARIWEGTTASGIRCHAYITRIAIDKDEPHPEQFERELKEQRVPSAKILAIPLRVIL